MRDLVVIALILLVVDTIGALLLMNVYLPRRRREALERAPRQMALLARDRQNALTGWVRERFADAELAANRLAETSGDKEARASIQEFIRAYAYESVFFVGDDGRVLTRSVSNSSVEPVAVQFALETMQVARPNIDFRRADRRPIVLTAHPLAMRNGSVAAVVFISNPADYVYPLFSTTTVASKSSETNLIGLYGEWGVALNPYANGFPPPMTLRKRIPKEFAAKVLALGEHSARYKDRNGMPVISVVKAIPGTPWIVVAKIDEAEVLAGAVSETWRLARLFGGMSLILALTVFALLRSRRVRELRLASDELARLFENSINGIIVFRVIFDGGRTPVDHQIVGMNPTAERLLGVSAIDEIGKRSSEADYLQWPADERARNYQVAIHGTPIQYEVFNPVHVRWYETRSFSPRHGQFAHLITDITERKKSDEAIRNLSARLLRVQDDTRRQIARDLHETVAQSLAGVRMNLGVIKRLVRIDRVAVATDESIAATDDAITQVRTLSYLLHPPMIDQTGLVTALQWYVDGFERRSGIATELVIPDELGRCARDVETCVFRIVQEGLTNIQRHSGSTSAVVKVESNDNQIVIEIADDGRGLPKAIRDDRDALLASGVGIAGINERAHELGGEMTIDSTDKGTTLRVTLPVAINDAEEAAAG